MRESLLKVSVVVGSIFCLIVFANWWLKYPPDVIKDAGPTVEECRAHSEENIRMTEIAEESARAHAEEDEIWESVNASAYNEIEEQESIPAEPIYGVSEVGTDGDRIVSKNSEFKGISFADYMSREGGRAEVLDNSILGEYGIRYQEGKPLISLSKSYGGNIGDTVTIELSTGHSLTCVIADIKDDDGSVMNVICNEGYLPNRVKKIGSFSCIEEFSGEVTDVLFE